MPGLDPLSPAWDARFERRKRLAVVVGLVLLAGVAALAILTTLTFDAVTADVPHAARGNGQALRTWTTRASVASVLALVAALLRTAGALPVPGCLVVVGTGLIATACVVVDLSVGALWT